jgi:putative DNA primase/helicase
MTDELPKGTKYNSQVLKSLASKDDIVGEAKFEDAVTFKPTHKLWIQGNTKPTIDDESLGFARRFVFVPHFWQIPEEQQLLDSEVMELFRPELPGILQWVIAGWKHYRATGKLIVPSCLKSATKDYLEENIEKSAIVQFLTECDEIETFNLTDNSIMAGSAKLAQAYTDWATKYRKEPMSQRKFSEQMEKVVKAKKHYHKGKYFWLGVKLVDHEAESQPFQSSPSFQPRGSFATKNPKSRLDMSDIDIDPSFDDIRRKLVEDEIV